MRQRTVWLSSLGMGAATAFLFDPRSGSRRRHRLADAAVHVTNLTTRTAGAIGRDFRNRTRGVLASARHRVTREMVDDVVLHERVRAALGRVALHPHAITVKVHDGRVVLDGPIRAGEKYRVLHAVRSVEGVRAVETRFDRHIQAAHAPSWQDDPSGRRTAPKPDILRRDWAPATRAIVGACGAALVVSGVSRRNRTGAGLAAAGAGLIARALTNLPLRHLAALAADRKPRTDRDFIRMRSHTLAPRGAARSS